MSRWLYNVNAVRAWKTQGADHPRINQISWWPPVEVPNSATSTPAPSTPAPSTPTPSTAPVTPGLPQMQPPTVAPTGLNPEIPAELTVGNFNGQGRQMAYCGLAYPTIKCVRGVSGYPDSNDLAKFTDLARDVAALHKGRRPGLWFWCAIRALFLVWIPILMAFIVSFTSPTVGIGCWSGSLLVFGGLTSFSWVVMMFNRSFGRWLKVVCHVVNLVAMVFLVFITGLVVSDMRILSAISRDSSGADIRVAERSNEQLLLQHNVVCVPVFWGVHDL